MGFEFKTKPTVEIVGKNYECDVTNSDLISGAIRDFPEIIKAGQRMEQTQKELRGAILKQDAKRIEGLGEQSIEGNNEIFTKRKPNSTEHLELCVYLFEFLMSGREKVVEEYLDLPEAENVAD